MVTGVAPNPPAEVRKQARAITPNLGEPTKALIAQFQEPVCPGIVGMGMDVAETMVSRIRSNAEAIGLPVAREGKCTPNIVVFFVANGQQTIQALQNRRSDLFRSIPFHELKMLAADPGPVHAWVNTTARGRHGDKLRGDEDNDLFSPPTVYVANSHSHIWLNSRRDITSSVIMMDLKAVYGMSAVQLADYASMRTFVQTRPPEGDARVPTILALFDKTDARPSEMTDFDLSYLRAIYGSRPNINAASRLGQVTEQLRKQRAERTAEK